MGKSIVQLYSCRKCNPRMPSGMRESIINTWCRKVSWNSLNLIWLHPKYPVELRSPPQTAVLAKFQFWIALSLILSQTSRLRRVTGDPVSISRETATPLMLPWILKDPIHAIVEIILLWAMSSCPSSGWLHPLRVSHFPGVADLPDRVDSSSLGWHGPYRHKSNRWQPFYLHIEG